MAVLKMPSFQGFIFYILTILEILLKAIIVAIVMIAIISMPEVIWNNKSSY